MRLKDSVVPLLAGCLLLAGLLPGAAWAKPSEHPFEIVPGSFHFTLSGDQAGAHADWVTSLQFAHEESGATYNDAREIVVELPAGFVASNTAVPTCTQAQLFTESTLPGSEGLPACPVASQLGDLSTEIVIGSEQVRQTTPVYNMEVTSFGTTAELGYIIGPFIGLLQIQVRPQDEGLTARTPNIAPVGEVHNISVTIWGVPASSENNAMRGALCTGDEKEPETCKYEFGGPQQARVPVKPFLSNPTSCGTFHASLTALSWEDPYSPSEAHTEVGPIDECNRPPFEPAIEVNPSTLSAESPTGLAVSLVVPQQWGNPFTLSTAHVQDTKVTLPEGVTINPSAGSGLGACTPQQYAAETSSSLPGEACPPQSKLGSILIETPLLDETIPGAIYLATPYENPFSEPGHPNGSLLALYVVAKDPERGLLIKVAGKIEPNPETGQLVTTFLDTPQQPFSRFTLKFRPGATAPLVSPPACGTYTTQGELTPWSEPLEPRLVSSTFTITQGIHEGACPTGGVPPFKPHVISGTANNDAGSYSPFYLRIGREDGEQELTKFTTVLPPGLTGNLTGIPFCSDADIEAAKQLTGAEEEAHPSCPAASQIGHTVVEAGVGTVLAQTPGKIYLAGPYNGAPLSVVSITSADVGPFDLGTVVIRFALDINPITAQVEVSGAQSDPIPHIIRGIVVHVRDIRAYFNREKFILNPTNCEASTISETITGAGADPANPADQMTVGASAPFEAADCSSLQFHPDFTVSTQGKTSGGDGASLTAKLTYPNAPQGTQTNIKSVRVELPKQLPSRLTTLQKACTAKVFDVNPANCPAASLIGHATATTPLIPVPLAGPAYFVSNGTAKFPELIMVLQGYGFTIDLHGETFISKTGVTSTTFSNVPDQPIGAFELTLPEGPDSALTAVGSLCKTALQMPTTFDAQNGQQRNQTTKVAVTGCPKAKGATHKKKKKDKKGKHNGNRSKTKKKS